MLCELHINNEIVKKVHDNWINNKVEENFPELKWKEPQMHPEIGFYYKLFEYAFDETQEFSYEDDYLSIDKCQYGVADNEEQIKEYFKDEINDKTTNYVIEIDYVFQNKENAGNAYGTWRWEKWGPYIGKFEPMHEYLDDEDFGENFKGYLILFHLKRVNNLK